MQEEQKIQKPEENEVEVELEEKKDEKVEAQQEEATEEKKPDELEDYSANVKSRIDKLTRKMREEERQKESAIQFAESVKKENESLKTRLDNLDKGYLEEDISFTEKNFKEVASEISPKILEKFLNYEVSNVYIGYNKFISAITQEPNIIRVLPFDTYESDSDANDVLIEPDVEDFIDIVFPQFFNLILSSIMLDAITSEHAARTAAMDNATRNADDIIKETTKLFNKTRQASITTELMDIVNGAEAVK